MGEIHSVLNYGIGSITYMNSAYQYNIKIENYYTENINNYYVNNLKNLIDNAINNHDIIGKYIYHRDEVKIVFFKMRDHMCINKAYGYEYYVLYSNNEYIATDFMKELIKCQNARKKCYVNTINVVKNCLDRYETDIPNVSCGLFNISNIVMSDYKKNKNVKVMLYGKKNIKLLDVGLRLKNMFMNTGSDPWLINFDIDKDRIDVNNLILSKSSESHPVILLIDNIGRYYNNILNDESNSPYTISTTSFHNFLDSIGDRLNVICLYKIDRNPIVLYQDEKYKSFMRKGRVDFFLKNDNDNYDGVELITHESTVEQATFYKSDVIKTNTNKKENGSDYFGLIFLFCLNIIKILEFCIAQTIIISKKTEIMIVCISHHSI